MKISVKICSGTACYVMGGAALLNVSEHLTPEELAKVDIQGQMCMDLCDGYNPNTPFAKVGETVVESATIETLVEAIRKAINMDDSN